MLNLIIFIVVTYGFSNMIVYSNGPFHIFEKWRDFTNRLNENIGELFNCMMCFPMWVGFALSILDIFVLKNIYFTPMNMVLNVTNVDTVTYVISIFLDGCFASGMTWLIHTIQEYFENKSNIE